MTHRIAIAAFSYDTWRMRSMLSLLVFAGLAFLPAPSSAFDLEENLKQEHVQYQSIDPLQTVQSSGMSLSQATQSVRSRTGGQILDAQTRVQGGREVHHIKVLLKDGKVKTFKVNGRQR